MSVPPFPRGRLCQPEYTLVITCFFDDSGQEGQADHRHVVLAGYIGNHDSWWLFQQRWEHLLMVHGIPEIHMKNWLSTAAAKGWSTVKRNTVLLDFIEVINGCRLIGLGAAVDANVWRNLPEARRKKFGDAQEFCFQRIVRRTIDRLEQVESREDISLIFDQDFTIAGRRLNLFKHIYKGDSRVRNRVAQVSFANSRAFSQLQAADILAWHTRRQLYAQEKHEPELASWKALFTKMPFVALDYEGEFWNKEMMEANFTAVEKELAANGRIAIQGVSSPKKKKK